MTAGQPPEPGGALAVGDPIRPRIKRAVFAALLAGAIFSVLTGPVKQVAALYQHAPWLNDPYDTVVSFAMFFVPLIAACCLIRLPLCRRSGPLPLARVRDLLRGCQAILAVTAATLLAEWVSVAVRANRPQWNGATWLQVGLLALMTVLTASAVRAVVILHRAGAAFRPLRAGAAHRAVPAGGGCDAGHAVDLGAGQPGAEPPGDWLTDLVAVVALHSRWLGPLDRPAASVLTWTERHPLAAVRRHPVRAAAIAAAAFGAAVGGRQAMAEGYTWQAAVLTIVLLACGMFAFLVVAGGYLGLIRSGTALVGVRRRVLDAIVLTCCGLLAVLAFRSSLWWIVGSNSAAAGVPQVYALLGICAVAFFTAVLAAESLRGSHAALRDGPARADRVRSRRHPAGD